MNFQHQRQNQKNCDRAERDQPKRTAGSSFETARGDTRSTCRQPVCRDSFAHATRISMRYFAVIISGEAVVTVRWFADALPERSSKLLRATEMEPVTGFRFLHKAVY